MQVVAGTLRRRQPVIEAASIHLGAAVALRPEPCCRLTDGRLEDEFQRVAVIEDERLEEEIVRPSLQPVLDDEIGGVGKPIAIS